MSKQPNTVCYTCQTPIWKDTRSLRNNRVFCSKRCFGESCRKIKICHYCGQSMWGSKKNRFCSVACSNKNRVGTFHSKSQGKKSGNAYVVEVRKQALIQLRGEKCERCPYDKIPVLTVHHKKGRKHPDAELFENLELLCPNCHAEIHRGLAEW